MSLRAKITRDLIIAILLAVSLHARAFELLVPDFWVNEGLKGQSTFMNPSIAADSNNNFIITWSNQVEIYARLYYSNGSALGSEFKVDQGVMTSDFVYHPSIAVTRSNVYMIVWVDERTGNPIILGRRLNSRAEPIGNEFRIDQAVGWTYIMEPSIAANGQGDFIITWMEEPSVTGDFNGDILARIYNLEGQPLRDEFKVDQGFANEESWDPAIATDGSNNFIIAWEEYYSGRWVIYARKFDSNGNPLGNQFRVDQGLAGDWAADPDVAANRNNHFLITWSRGWPNGPIFGRHYDDQGNPVGNEFRIDQSPVANSGFAPRAEADMKNNFIITWSAWSDYLNGQGHVYARQFDPQANPLSDEFRVYRGEHSGYCSEIEVGAGNHLIIAWNDTRNDSYDVYANIWGEDSDGDGLPDWWENFFSCLQAKTMDDKADYDSDGLWNAGEYRNATDPCDWDSDGDGMPDGWEVNNRLDPLQQDATNDLDADDLNNLEEYQNGTDPRDSDTDDDSYSDGLEVSKGTDPIDPASYPKEKVFIDDEDDSGSCGQLVGQSSLGALSFLPALIFSLFRFRRRFVVSAKSRMKTLRPQA